MDQNQRDLPFFGKGYLRKRKHREWSKPHFNNYCHYTWLFGHQVKVWEIARRPATNSFEQVNVRRHKDITTEGSSLNLALCLPPKHTKLGILCHILRVLKSPLKTVIIECTFLISDPFALLAHNMVETHCSD